MEGKISMVQLIQYGFSRSLGSATSNEANHKSLCNLNAARRVPVDHHSAPSSALFAKLAQMKNQYFLPECYKKNAIFSVTSYHNRSYLNNI